MEIDKENTLIKNTLSCKLDFPWVISKPRLKDIRSWCTKSTENSCHKLSCEVPKPMTNPSKNAFSDNRLIATASLLGTLKLILLSFP